MSGRVMKYLQNNMNWIIKQLEAQSDQHMRTMADFPQA